MKPLIRLLDIHIISHLRELQMSRNNDLDCELRLLRKSNKKNRINIFFFCPLQNYGDEGHLSVMSFENYSESSMPYKVLLVVNKFTDVFRHCREELLTPRGRMCVVSLRRRMFWRAVCAKTKRIFRQRRWICEDFAVL